MSKIIKLTESQLRDVVAKVINEQKASPNASQTAKQIWDNLARAVNNMGTDKQGIVSAISMIKSVELYTEVVNMMRGASSIGTYKSIVQLLNGRFGVYDYKYFKQIQSILTKIGVKITAQTSGPAQNPFLKVGSIRQEVGPAAKPSTTPDANKPTYKVCQGFPIKYGCKQTEVGRLQQCLGLKVDYSFGPNTLVALVDHSTKKYSKESIALQKQYVEVGVSKAAYDLLLQKCKKSVVKTKQKSQTGKLATAPVVDTRTKTEPLTLKSKTLQTLPTTNLALSPEQIRANLQRDLSALKASAPPQISQERKDYIINNINDRGFDQKYVGDNLTSVEQDWVDGYMKQKYGTVVDKNKTRGGDTQIRRFDTPQG
jgi:hypothetical protein